MKYSLHIEADTLEEIQGFIDTALNKVIEKHPLGDSATSIPVIPKPPAPTEVEIVPLVADIETVAEDGSLTTTVAETPETDVNGLPWDKRIHAGTKTKTAKGAWKKRKGVHHSVVTEVEAELKTAAPVESLMDLVVPETAPVAAPPAPAAPAAPVEIKRDFNGLMNQVSKLFANQEITPDYPNTIVSRINGAFETEPNINTISDVANSEHMVQYAWQCLDVDQKAA